VTKDAIVEFFVGTEQLQAYCDGIGVYAGFYQVSDVCINEYFEYFETDCYPWEGGFQGWYNIAIMVCCNPGG